VARDLLVLSLFPILARRGVPRLEVNFTGKTATACLLVGLTWLAVSETSFGWADIGDEVGLIFVIAGAVLYWIAGAMYAREAARRWKVLPGGTV
jgi:cardiolipin synthase